MTGKYMMLDALEDFATRVNKLEIPYMVTGSFAMGVYVPGRTTMDIDVVIEINRDDASRFETAFIEDYYVSAGSIRRAVDDRSMFNIIGNTHCVKIDCIVRKESDFEKAKFARRQLGKIAGVAFWVISKEDLILSKLRWAAGSLSERQFEDIDRLLTSGPDRGYIAEWVDREALQHVWAEFDKWKIRSQK